MIIKHTKKEAEAMTIVSLSDLVPQDHLLRKIDKSIDFNFIKIILKKRVLPKLSFFGTDLSTVWYQTNTGFILYYFQILNSKIWKELEEETNGNIKIVRTKDVMGFYFDKDYKLEEDISGWHPNARVWKEFTPKFVSQYIK